MKTNALWIGWKFLEEGCLSPPPRNGRIEGAALPIDVMTGTYGPVACMFGLTRDVSVFDGFASGLDPVVYKLFDATPHIRKLVEWSVAKWPPAREPFHGGYGWWWTACDRLNASAAAFASPAWAETKGDQCAREAAWTARYRRARLAQNGFFMRLIAKELANAHS